MKALAKLIQQGMRARIAVRLEDDVNLPIVAQPRRRERGANLRRMVAVIVDYVNSALFSAGLKAPVHACVSFHRGANYIHCDVEFQADRDGRGCVQYVVKARYTQMKFAQIAVVLA